MSHTRPQPPSLEWIRPTRQARSRETLERLLDAAEALIEEKGFDDVPVSEIARRAHSSVGACYARFRGKASILHALHERFTDEAYATAAVALDPDRWEGASIPEIISACVDFLVKTFRERAGLERTLAVQASHDNEIRERSERLGRHVNEGITRLVLARPDEIGHPDPALACDFACRQLFAALTQIVAQAGVDPATRPLSDEQVSAELTRSILAYLDVRDPTPRR